MIVVATFRTVEAVFENPSKEVFVDEYVKVDSLDEAEVIYKQYLNHDKIYSASIVEVVKSTDYTPDNVISNIDFKALRAQKDILIQMIQGWGEADDPDQRKQVEEMEGLLSLIDNIQDRAVEYGYVEEKDAFNLNEE